ncbi:MAG: TetR/AcrR family transcriptional regulator [Solirubrobacterales bacterium]
MPPEAAVAAGPGRLLSLALDPSVAPPDDATSQRILDAALALVANAGMRGVTMDAVAGRAAVGRMTVYRRFGDRAGLVEALTVRETRRSLAQIAATQANPELGPVELVAEGFAAAIRIAREHPLFSRISALDVIGGLNSPQEKTARMLREFLAELIRDGQRRDEMRDVDPEHAAELLLRIGASFLLIPRSVIPLDDDAAARRAARELIAPLVAA